MATTPGQPRSAAAASSSAGRDRSARLSAERRLERAPDLLDGDHAAQDAFAVDSHQRAQASERLGPQQFAERAILVDPPAADLRRLERHADVSGLTSVDRGLHALLAGDAEEPAVAVDDGNHDHP